MKTSKVCRGTLIALTLAGMLLAVAPAFAGGPYQYHAVTPCRVVDSRTVNATETTDGNILHGMLHCFIIQGQCGIPTGATAVTANFTVVTPTQPGDLRVSPNDGSTEPLTSTLNWVGGEPALANGAIVPLSGTLNTCNTTNTTGNVSAADLRVRIAGGGNAHLLIDVTGYFQ
jgi:hypothetical protein